MANNQFITIKVLHHGTTLVHWDCEGAGGSRTALVYARVDRACGTFVWEKPAWSPVKTAGFGAVSTEFTLNINPEENVPPMLVSKYTSPQADCASVSLEEGYLDLSSVKEVTIGCCDKDRETELRGICKRYGLPGSDSCIGLMYGSNVSDNRLIFLLGPPTLSKSV